MVVLFMARLLVWLHPVTRPLANETVLRGFPFPSLSTVPIITHMYTFVNYIIVNICYKDIKKLLKRVAFYVLFLRIFHILAN